MHSYRELTAPELVTAFVQITGGYINKGRDAHMISEYMKRNGIGPTVVLEGMYELAESTATKDIPTLIRGEFCGWDQDLLLIEASLVGFIQDGHEGAMPPFLSTYQDLLEQDLPSAQIEAIFLEAKERLTEYCDNALTKPSSFRTRSRLARRNNEHGATNTGSS